MVYRQRKKAKEARRNMEKSVPPEPFELQLTIPGKFRLFSVDLNIVFLQCPFCPSKTKSTQILYTNFDQFVVASYMKFYIQYFVWFASHDHNIIQFNGEKEVKEESDHRTYIDSRYHLKIWSTFFCVHWTITIISCVYNMIQPYTKFTP